MTKLFIRNPSDEDKTFICVGDGGARNNVDYTGPEGAIAFTLNRMNVCLAPAVKTLTTAKAFTTEEFEFDGEIVLEVGPNLIQHSFTKQTIVQAFDGTLPAPFNRIKVVEVVGKPGFFTIENLMKTESTKVRLYLVSQGMLGSLSTDFTPLDSVGNGIGVDIPPAYNVSCVGSTPFTGILEVVVQPGETSLNNGVVNKPVADINDFCNTLTTEMNIEAFVVETYVVD